MLSRQILSEMYLAKWKVSSAWHEILGFIESVSKSVEQQVIRDENVFSANIESIKKLLEELETSIDAFPPLESAQRFGNKAFSQWHEWLCENASELCKKYVNAATLSCDECSVEEALAETVEYLTLSFGHPLRIDYGTGHELAFIAFLICLFKLGHLKLPETIESSSTSDLSGVGLAIMPAYLKVVRKLQLTYRMEPAGSHGVYSLDDFQFVPFIWGSSQLFDHSYKTASIPDDLIAESEKDAQLFFSCLNYIRQVKSGPFEEHSSILYSLTNVPHWRKVNSGLMKMYKGEVMEKFPVVQHFLFGKLLSWDPKKAL